MSNKIQISFNKSVEIIQDVACESPRNDEGKLGFMVSLNHRRYNLPKECKSFSFDSCTSMADANKKLVKQHKAVVILPVYMYDHSGLVFSTTPFSCPWDSRQCGFIFTTKEKIKEQLGVKKVTQKILDHVKLILAGEIESYSAYMAGETYGYIMYDENGIETDSCWGFLGSDFKTNGLIDNLGLNDEEKESFLSKVA